ncbi:MAG: hypothetical protein M1371_07885 [Actinobacteria bacterium]|nr:hypothetical protein [Actinomycetota bacterium]
MIPLFEERIIKEDGPDIVLERSDGKIIKTKKDGSSAPMFLKYPVENREDFSKLKKRYNPNLKDRLPKNWEELRTDYENRSYPIQLGQGPDGFFGILRELMGIERACIAFYDEPDFVHEIFDFYTSFWRD